MDQPMPGEPAPGRNINRSPLVTGHEMEALPGRQPLEPALESQQHRPAGQVTGVPGIVMRKQVHIHPVSPIDVQEIVIVLIVPRSRFTGRLSSARITVRERRGDTTRRFCFEPLPVHFPETDR